MARLDDIFARANSRLFARFGDEAVLQGGWPLLVVISAEVKLLAEYGEIDQAVTTATFRTSARVQARDTLQVLTGPHAGLWRLDRALARDGSIGLSEWIIVRIAAPAPGADDEGDDANEGAPESAPEIQPEEQP